MRFPFLLTTAAVATTTVFAAAVDVTKGATAEAEDGVLNGITVGTASAGFSGTGYVEGFDADADSLTITLYSETQALYDLVVRYAALSGGKQTKMALNGAGGAQIIFTPTTPESPWADASAGQVLLNAGDNNITFINDWGWYFIDSLSVTPAPPPEPHAVNSMLVVPDVLPVTQALYNKLLSKYGSGEIFSGQAELSGIDWLEKNVGQTPAILALDFMDYSPSRVAFNSSSMAVEEGISWDARGGILTYQWHWNAPSHVINNDTVPWYKGFYTYGTTFNLTQALADPSSTEYALLISDMDAIAKLLLRLQEANVPILWRPLHEADGTWFWWGAHGPESCKTLYRMMFDRYTNVHKLRNLIWVWNSVTPSWYPGDDVVDIVGYDSYPPIGDHGPVSPQYQQLIDLGQNRKMVTLPEVGNIPDPDILKAYRVNWSYFVVWSGEFIETDKYNPLEFKKRVYEDPTVLKLADLGDWKTGV
ncbi:hypothetical protein LZ554_005461 [Drepanopeziza brunnea f. sp. 'monogermtubi']|nr:hypothetical protein LZ554_005461 [Drepanopeziza brunnea f. sp. 'monogermtubi']